MSIWLQISAGTGPEECCRVVKNLCFLLEKEAKENHLTISLLSAVKSRTGFSSALFSVDGDSESFVDSWTGTIQFIGKSPFRPDHKRKNWFVSVASFSTPEVFSFQKSDLQIDVQGASGPGGQHANRTKSGVRLIHRPSGLSTQATEERSQTMNHKLALARMEELFIAKNKEALGNTKQLQWSQHNTLERGNPKRVLRARDFR